ncbi:MAG: ABC transporter permease [Eubacterium sp.]|nr:ABC transporter permease [Eubacterium sp.]
MNLLNKIPIKNLKLNKKRTIVTIIGIILSVALLTATASLYSSFIQSLINYEVKEQGNFHVAYHNVPISDLDTFRNNSNISDICIAQDEGYAKIESKNDYKPYAFIKKYTKDALDNLSVTLAEGRLPENENEIVIPTHLKTNGRNNLKVGDSISLDVGQRVDGNGNVLNQNNAYEDTSTEESLINTTNKTYTVVGVAERPAKTIEAYSAPGYTFITYTDESNLTDNVDVYVKYTKKAIKNWVNVTAEILDIDPGLYDSLNEDKLYELSESQNIKYQIDTNGYLVGLESGALINSSASELEGVIATVLAIIVFTSVFCIKNSFDISITEKTKQYGMLKSIGATKKQIRKNVFFEATVLGLIGIPIGLVMGCLASFILIIVCRYFTAESDMPIAFSISPYAILVAVVLGIITIYFSAFKSARRASKLSPIDSIRNSADIKIKRKKIKAPKAIKKIFGIGGEISYKNLKRNKKKYRTTVISIVVSVLVFIALSGFMDSFSNIIEQDIQSCDYNIYLMGNIHDNENRYNKYLSITKLDNIDNYTALRNMKFEVYDIKYNNDFLNKQNLTYQDIVSGDSELNLMVCSIGDEQYQKYIKSLGLNYEDIKDKAILMDYDPAYSNTRVYDYQIGDVITNKTNDKSLQVGYVTEVVPFGLKGNVYHQYFIVSDEMLDSLLSGTLPDGVDIYIQSSNADKLQDEIEDLLSDETHYFLRNLDENYREQKNMITLFGIFLYGFIIVVSLVGLTNIFNTITTNMELRKPEFAMLKSVGMTTKEFNRMIRLESIFMGVKSLFFGLPIGIALSYLIHHCFTRDYVIPYHLPVIPVIISIFVVFLLISIIMKYSIVKISKQNTIETIRNENI